MPDYSHWKALHIGCVALSFAGFVLRFGLRLRSPASLRTRIARIAPHVVDTLLLASALALVWIGWPGVPGWIRAKIVALLVYIVLGSIALKPARGSRASLFAFAGAIIAFGYIVSVALTKSPWGLLAMAG